MADVSSCSEDNSETDDCVEVEEEILEELSNNGTSEEVRCRYKSEVWRFFVKMSEKSIKCNLCNKMLAYHGGTSSMLQHLDRKHPAQTTKRSGGRKQTSLDVFMRKRICSSERAGVISDHIAGVIVNDLCPINLMAGQAFKDLMAYLEPGYRLPSPIHFTHLIKRKYGAVKERVQSQLQQHTEFTAIAADLWVSVALGSYLTVILIHSGR